VQVLRSSVTITRGSPIGSEVANLEDYGARVSFLPEWSRPADSPPDGRTDDNARR